MFLAFFKYLDKILTLFYYIPAERRYKMQRFFDKQVIIKFYKTLKFNNFKTLNLDRIQEIDEIVERYRPIFINNTIGLLTLMHYTAERLITSSRNYGLTNGDEKAYFYMKMVDPDFLFLEVYEAANMKDEIKDFSMKNFRIYDGVLIKLEKQFNELFMIYGPNDLWSRERIKR